MEQHYLCQKCRKVFPGSQLKEVQLKKNMVVRNPMSSVYIKEDGMQYVPGCPHCDNVFFFLNANKFEMKGESYAETDAK